MSAKVPRSEIVGKHWCRGDDRPRDKRLLNIPTDGSTSEIFSYLIFESLMYRGQKLTCIQINFTGRARLTFSYFNSLATGQIVSRPPATVARAARPGYTR